MSRPVIVLLTAAVLVTATPAAHAQVVVNYGTMQMTLKHKVGSGYETFNAMELLEEFNLPNCLCHVPFTLEMTLAGAPVSDLGTTPVEIWVGPACDNFTTERTMSCVKLTTFPIEAFHNRIVDFDIDTGILDSPLGGCSDTAPPGTNKVWALVDQNSDQTYDNDWSIAVSYDTQPPPAPTDVTLTGVEDGVEVSWTIPTVGIEDVRSYQIVCASSIDGSPIFTGTLSDSFKPDFARTEDIDGCTAPDTPTSTGVDAGTSTVADAAVSADAAGFRRAQAEDAGPLDVDAATVDAAPVDAAPVDAAPVDAPLVADAAAVDASTSTSGFDLLDPSYVCSSPASKTSTSIRVDLTNARPLAANEYVIAKLVITDNSLNHTVVDVPGMAHVVPDRNAWGVYEDDGGKATGGYCAITIGGAGKAGAGIALLVVVGVLVVRRRRGAAAVVLVVGALASRPAAAQVYLDEAPHADVVVEEIPPSDWAFEIKIGPYYPDVDKEPGLTGKPYAETFGDGVSILPQLEMDWTPFHLAGELGFTASFGVMSNTAKAFALDPTTGGHVVCTTANASTCRTSDDTSFILYPAALGLIYRFTEISDRTVVPIVPYVKFGLSYYMWRVTKGNGDVAMTASGGDASGATLGFQGSIGIAIRAERFDPDSAKSLQEDLGVNHAGFFIEATYAKVDGLGASNKLHVGDLFWSAGLVFEF